MYYLVSAGQACLALLLAPGLVGLIRWMKARLQSRRGSPIWQPYLELRKLFRKEVVVSNNASWLFHAAPFVIFATTVATTALVPVLAAPAALDRMGDLVAILKMPDVILESLLVETILSGRARPGTILPLRLAR